MFKTTYAPRDIVKYRFPEPGEDRLRFLVIDGDFGRVTMRCINFPVGAIAPVETVGSADVMPADQWRP